MSDNLGSLARRQRFSCGDSGHHCGVLSLRSTANGSLPPLSEAPELNDLTTPTSTPTKSESRHRACGVIISAQS